MILIYNDEGVSVESLQGLIAVFEAAKKPVQIVNAAILQKSDWMTSASMLVIPGGRSLPFYRALGEQGNRHIVSFVKQGGTYLGLCAGAYYACAETIFAQDLPLELRLPGELNFFEGRAIGPVFLANEFAYQSEAGADFVDIIDNDRVRYSVYFNGGCYFEAAEEIANCHIKARYVDNEKAAIISCVFGAGRAILSGVHPELSTNECVKKELLLKIIA